MSNLLDVLTAVKTIRTEIQASHLVGALRQTPVIIEFVCDVAESVGFKGTAEDATCKEELKTEIAGCIADCEACHAAVASDPTSKIGDGKILELLGKVLTLLLPLLL